MLLFDWDEFGKTVLCKFICNMDVSANKYNIIFAINDYNKRNVALRGLI